MILLNEIYFLLPEILILILACVLLVSHLFVRDHVLEFSHTLSQLAVVGAAISLLQLPRDGVHLLFSGHFVFDPLAVALKLSVLVLTSLVLLYTRDYLKNRNIRAGEYHVMILFALLGMLLLISAHTLLMTYLGLELLSLPLYALVAMERDSSITSEAAVKYFVLGALASGLLLYGFSIFYGVSGSLEYGEIVTGLQLVATEYHLVLALALVFVVIAIAFKLGVAPFHMWVPDVYAGAPAVVTLVIATLPKIAVFAMLIRLFFETFSAVGLQSEWQSMLMILALLSIGLGNLAAIAQTDIKRLFAYSAIAHMGFMLLGVLAGNSDGASAAMFYVITYALVSAGGFGMIILLSHEGIDASKLSDYKGLSVRNPWYALMMLFLVFAMAGVPPTVGFYAKFAVLEALVSAGYLPIAIVVVIFSVIGAFYYLRLIKVMYFEAPEDPTQISSSTGMALALSCNGLAALLLGLMPGWLFALCRNVFL